MAGRLEWQPISAQGLNPLGAIGTSVAAFKGAADTAQALRDSERMDDALIQKSYENLVGNYLEAGKLDVLQQTEARKAREEQSFNPAQAERIFNDHYFAGGTPDNFVDNPEVMGLINQFGDDVFQHGIKTFDRFNTGIEKEETNLMNQAESTRSARILDIDAMDVDEAVKARLKGEAESEYTNTVAGIRASAANNFANIQRSRNRFLGLEPAEATTGGGASRPVERQAAKSNEFNEYMSQLQSEHAAEADRIDQDHLNGLINDAEYSRQRAELDENYNQQLSQWGKDSRRYNMVSGSGETLALDYSDLPDGGIQIGNRTIPANIGNAFRTASDAFDVPMETLLAFASLESNFNASAESPTGVQGVMQVTRETGREMFNRYRNLFESEGITNPDDRTNPKVSAMTGAAYLQYIREDILQGDAPIEQLYVAYNIGPNSPVVKQFHHRNMPIDRMPGVDVESEAIQANKGLYYDKDRGAWRTPAEISAVVRERMGVSPNEGNPVATINQRATAGNQETTNEPVVDTELNAAQANSSFHQLDFNRDPIGELSRVTELADSVQPMQAIGAGGKQGSQLSAPEFSSMLTTMGITPTPDRIKELHRIVTTHDVLSTMPAEEVSVILSFAPEGTWGGIDKASTLRNIDTTLQLWDSQKEKIRAQMTSADNLRKYSSAYSEARERLQGRIAELETSLNKLDNRELTSLEERAREETARLLVSAQRELASATSMYQGRMQEDYEKILRFRQELRETRLNAPSGRAQEVINQLKGRARGNRFNALEAAQQNLDDLAGSEENSLTSYIDNLGR